MSAPTSRDIERDVEEVRYRLDYPDTGELAGYRAALEALDRLARLAHSAVALPSGEKKPQRSKP